MIPPREPPFQFGLGALLQAMAFVAVMIAVLRAGDAGKLLFAFGGIAIGVGGLICIGVFRLTKRRRS